MRVKLPDDVGKAEVGVYLGLYPQGMKSRPHTRLLSGPSTIAPPMTSEKLDGTVRSPAAIRLGTRLERLATLPHACWQESPYSN